MTSRDAGSAGPTGPDPADPDPATTAGLGPGGQVAPGDTPPGESSLSGAHGGESSTPNHGPVSGNRTPMVITLVALGVLVVMCAVLVGASFLPS